MSRVSQRAHTPGLAEKRKWESKRDTAIERLVAALEKYEAGGDYEEVSTALDVVTVAHMARAFAWDTASRRPWEEKESEAIEKVVTAWKKYETSGELPEELNGALDNLSVAHTAAAFEGWSGPLKW